MELCRIAVSRWRSQVRKNRTSYSHDCGIQSVPCSMTGSRLYASHGWLCILRRIAEVWFMCCSMTGAWPTGSSAGWAVACSCCSPFCESHPSHCLCISYSRTLQCWPLLSCSHSSILAARAAQLLKVPPETKQIPPHHSLAQRQ